MTIHGWLAHRGPQSWRQELNQHKYNSTGKTGMDIGTDFYQNYQKEALFKHVFLNCLPKNKSIYSIMYAGDGAD